MYHEYGTRYPETTFLGPNSVMVVSSDPMRFVNL